MKSYSREKINNNLNGLQLPGTNKHRNKSLLFNSKVRAKYEVTTTQPQELHIGWRKNYP